MQALIGAAAYHLFPAADELPLLNVKGLLCALLLHVTVSETLFYLSHRLFHTDFLFRRYHSLHHSVPVPQSYTGSPPLTLSFSLCPLSKGQGLCSWTGDASGAPGAERRDGCSSRGQLLERVRVGGSRLRLCPGIRLTQVHAPRQRGGAPRVALPRPPLSQIPGRHPHVSNFEIILRNKDYEDSDDDDEHGLQLSHASPQGELDELLPVHAAIRLARRHAQRRVLEGAREDLPR